MTGVAEGRERCAGGNRQRSGVQVVHPAVWCVSPWPATRAAACIVAGEVGGSPPTDYVAELNPTTGKPGAAQPISGMYEVQGAGCASATECFVAWLQRQQLDVFRAVPSPVSKPSNYRQHKTGPGQADYGMACHHDERTCWGIDGAERKIGTRLEGIRRFSVHVPGVVDLSYNRNL